MDVMPEETDTAHRLAMYSDAVAVIVTVMVLELKAPEGEAFSTAPSRSNIVAGRRVDYARRCRDGYAPLLHDDVLRFERGECGSVQRRSAVPLDPTLVTVGSSAMVKINNSFADPFPRTATALGPHNR